eukprot:443484-Pelagomonas_calceolata.AAC.4
MQGRQHRWMDVGGWVRVWRKGARTQTSRRGRALGQPGFKHALYWASGARMPDLIALECYTHQCAN